MTKEAAILVTIAFAFLLLLLMAFAWRRRLRRDAGLSAPIGIPEEMLLEARHEVLYVATTRHDEPLERLTLTPLAYRARGELGITAGGVALALDGAPAVFLSSERLVGVGQSTWAIDRVVEAGGLVRIVWELDDGTVIDSYVRAVSTSTAELVRAIEPLCHANKDEGKG